MNFKKSWKRANDGFTLVELIVVIAILAILAGIAVPAYSGYIKKANKAADLQLLGAVNTAFAAAALENGDDVNEITNASLTYGGSEGAVTVTGVSSPAEYNEAFQRYYDGNTGSFKVLTRLVFDAEKHVFVDIDSAGGVTVSYRGTTVYVPAQLAATLGTSSFVQSENGVSDLLDQVDFVTDIAASLGGVGDFGDFMFNGIMSTLGVTDPTNEDQMAAFGEKYDALTAQKVELIKTDAATVAKLEKAKADAAAEGKTLDEADWLYTEAANQIAANNAVLQVAQGASGLDSTAFLNDLSTNGMSTSSFKDFLTDSENSDEALAKSAAAYALYTAYTNTLTGDAQTAAKGNLGSLTAVMNSDNGINSDAFKLWLTTDTAKNDLEAYKSSMELINNSAEGGATDDILVNGFADQALKDLIVDAMG